MNRRGAAWLLAVPLMLTGVECAHWLAYRIVYPDAYTRAQVLAASGHGYLSEAPTAAAVAAAIVLVALVARVAGGGGRTAAPVALPARLLALAPLAFGLQECIEELASGHSPFLAFYAPTFLPGLVLTLPFGLLAFVLARALLRGADRLTAVLFGPSPPRRRRALVRVRRPTLVLPVGVLLLGGGLTERGPPFAPGRG
jgi:hypothetical protein